MFLTELILSPTGHPASVLIKDLIGLRQAHGVNVLREVKGLLEEEQGEVVGEVARVELRVVDDVHDASVLMGLGFVGRLGVPLSATDQGSFSLQPNNGTINSSRC